MATDARLFECLLRNDLRALIEKAFTTLCPGQTFEMSWHIEAMLYQLERVRRGEIKRLIINMPPRMLKSITTSVVYPAYVLTKRSDEASSSALATPGSSRKSTPMTSAP